MSMQPLARALRTGLAFTGVTLLFLAVIGTVVGLVVGNIALVTYVTPWLLIITIPISIVIFWVGYSLFDWVLSKIVDWGWND